MTYAEALADLHAIGGRVVPREASWLMRLISFLIYPVNREFMDGYTTTIGHTVYMNSDLIGTDAAIPTVVHETVHVRQWRSWGPLFALSYVLAPPVGVPWFGGSMRAMWEREAYAVELVWFRDNRGSATAQAFANYIRAQFTGPSYGWMWPNRGAYDDWVESVLYGEGE